MVGDFGATGGFLTSPAGGGLPASFHSVLFSVWICTDAFTGMTLGNTGPNFGLSIGLDTVFGNVEVDIRRADSTSILHAVLPMPAIGALVQTHCLVGLDTASQALDVYVNRQHLTASLLTWTSTEAILNPPPGLSPGGPLITDMSGASSETAFCGDAWLYAGDTYHAPAGVLDAFIDTALNPVDLGTVGELPLGSSPQVFLHATAAGVPADFATNAGTGGAWTPDFSLTFEPPGTCTAPAPSVVIVAPDYGITLDEDTSLSSAVVATGADGLVYTILDAPAHGALTLNADGTYTYDAARAYFGADGFTYRATDPVSGAFDDGTVTITVAQAFPLTGVVKVLLPPAELQFCDANGVPYAGGSLEFYEPGTSTPKDTWSSPTGDTDTLNTNPLVLDAAGRALIYGDGAYRTVLRDAAGNLVWDQPSFTYVSACMVPVVGAADLATARQAMGVTDAIEAEAEARAAADSAEATARAAADTALGARIDAEIARAEAAEAALGTRIDGLPAPAPPGNVVGGVGHAGADGHARVTFGTPFATTCTSCVVQPFAPGMWSVSTTVNADRFGFDMWASVFGSKTPASDLSFFWMAIGN